MSKNENKNPGQVKISDICIDRCISKVANYRSSDSVSNMISTDLRKSGKCVCVSHTKLIPDKNAYDFAEEMIEISSSKGKRGKSANCRRGSINDQNIL